MSYYVQKKPVWKRYQKQPWTPQYTPIILPHNHLYALKFKLFFCGSITMVINNPYKFPLHHHHGRHLLVTKHGKWKKQYIHARTFQVLGNDIICTRNFAIAAFDYQMVWISTIQSWQWTIKTLYPMDSIDIGCAPVLLHCSIAIWWV